MDIAVSKSAIAIYTLVYGNGRKRKNLSDKEGAVQNIPVR